MNEKKHIPKNELSLTPENEEVLIDLLKHDQKLYRQISSLVPKLTGKQKLTQADINNVLTLTTDLEKSNPEFAENYEFFKDDFQDSLEVKEFTGLVQNIAQDENLNEDDFALYVKLKLLHDFVSQKLEKVGEVKKLDIDNPDVEYFVGQFGELVGKVVPILSKDQESAKNKKIYQRKRQQINAVSNSMKSIPDFKILNDQAVDNLVSDILEINNPSLCVQFLQKMTDVVYEDNQDNITTAKDFYEGNLREIVNNLAENIKNADLKTCSLALNAIGHIFDPKDWNESWQPILDKALQFNDRDYDLITLSQIIPNLRYFEDSLVNNKKVNEFIEKHEESFKDKSKEKNENQPSLIDARFGELLADYEKELSFESDKEIYIKGLFMDREVKDPETGNVLYVFQLDGSVHFKKDKDNNYILDENNKKVHTESTLRNTKKLQRLEIPYIRFNEDDFVNLKSKDPLRFSDDGIEKFRKFLDKLKNQPENLK